jgi:cbb3-type cytochrome oxidase subunit 3
MIQNILRHLGGIEQYGVVSLCLFGSIFIVVLVWAFAQKKSHLDYMARVALDTEADNSQKGTEHE